MNIIPYHILEQQEAQLIKKLNALVAYKNAFYPEKVKYSSVGNFIPESREKITLPAIVASTPLKKATVKDFVHEALRIVQTGTISSVVDKMPQINPIFIGRPEKALRAVRKYMPSLIVDQKAEIIKKRGNRAGGNIYRIIIPSS